MKLDSVVYSLEVKWSQWISAAVISFLHTHFPPVERQNFQGQIFVVCGALKASGQCCDHDQDKITYIFQEYIDK